MSLQREEGKGRRRDSIHIHTSPVGAGESTLRATTLSHVPPRSLSRVCSLFLYSGFPESFFFSAVLFTVVSLVDASPIQL